MKSKKIIITITVILLIAVIGLEAGLKIYHKNELRKAGPKAQLLFAAVQNAIKLRDAEQQNLKTYGKLSMDRCMDIVFAPVNEAIAKNLDPKEAYEKSDKKAAAAKCLALYKEKGDFIPALKIREENYTIHDENFDYLFTGAAKVNFAITEKSAKAHDMESFVNGYIWFYFDTPQEEGSAVQKVEVECNGMEYYKGVCPIVTDKLKSTDFGNIEFVFRNAPRTI